MATHLKYSPNLCNLQFSQKRKKIKFWKKACITSSILRCRHAFCAISHPCATLAAQHPGIKSYQLRLILSETVVINYLKLLLVDLTMLSMCSAHCPGSSGVFRLQTAVGNVVCLQYFAQCSMSFHTSRKSSSLWGQC